MTKARLLRKHGGIMPNPEDHRTLQHICGWKGGEKKNSKASAKGAKKTARHMAAETRYQGGERITMRSTSTSQWANDYSQQVAPRDGASYTASTGKTWLRKGVK